MRVSFRSEPAWRFRVACRQFGGPVLGFRRRLPCGCEKTQTLGTKPGAHAETDLQPSCRKAARRGRTLPGTFSSPRKAGKHPKVQGAQALPQVETNTRSDRVRTKMSVFWARLTRPRHARRQRERCRAPRVIRVTAGPSLLLSLNPGAMSSPASVQLPRLSYGEPPAYARVRSGTRRRRRGPAAASARGRQCRSPRCPCTCWC